MIDLNPEKINSDDLSELLVRVEKSFDIKFDDNEFKHISNFGELCDHISNKIQLENIDDCTTQQAFYKLRNSIILAVPIKNMIITPETLLIDILPRTGRLSATKRIESDLGFKISILRPPRLISGILALISIASLITLFFNWQIGVICFAFSIGGFWVASKLGKELDMKTVGEVAEKMIQENYLNSRRNPKTFNKAEIEKVLFAWFGSLLNDDNFKITRQTQFK